MPYGAMTYTYWAPNWMQLALKVALILSMIFKAYPDDAGLSV
jgi:hypothetical protein